MAKTRAGYPIKKKKISQAEAIEYLHKDWLQQIIVIGCIMLISCLLAISAATTYTWSISVLRNKWAAGLVSTIFSTIFALYDATAIATARYVLPVPAGPMPNVKELFLIACKYFAWLTLFALIGLPLCVNATASDSEFIASLNLDAKLLVKNYEIKEVEGIKYLDIFYETEQRIDNGGYNY